MPNLLVSHSYRVRLKRETILLHGASTSTIRLGDQLNSTSQLVSKGRNFTLGFFTIDNTNYSYIGIWYTNDDQARRAWAGNPNVPLVTDSAVLMYNRQHHWEVGHRNRRFDHTSNAPLPVRAGIHNESNWDVNWYGAMTMPKAMRLGYYATSLGRVSWDIALGCAIGPFN
ncbi:hypothetical protein LguiB_009441 [Lonicera macranthoides]